MSADQRSTDEWTRAKVVFAGVARNCGAHLAAVLANVDMMGSCFREAAFVFVENDSSDETKAILAGWGRGRPNFTLFNLDGLGQNPVRTLRLEIARNVYLEYVKSDAKLSAFDYLCVLDMDDSNAQAINPASFARAMEFIAASPDRAGVFANQIGNYYDMWALRQAPWCPDDVWYEVLQEAHRTQASDEEAFNTRFLAKIRSIGPETSPIEVESAFGGLGIYRMEIARRSVNPYLGVRVRVLPGRDGKPAVFRTQTCEHVHFNDGLRQWGGKLYILPFLINGTAIQMSFVPSFYRSICF